MPAVFEKTVDETVAEETITLLKPTPRQQAQMKTSAKSWHKERLGENLRLAGIDGMAMLPYLQNFDRTPMTLGDFLAYINDDNGQVEAMELALADNPSAEAIVLALVREDRLLSVVAKLWGFDVVTIDPTTAPAAEETVETAPAEEPAPKDPADGPAPLCFGQPTKS